MMMMMMMNTCNSAAADKYLLTYSQQPPCWAWSDCDVTRGFRLQLHASHCMVRHFMVATYFILFIKEVKVKHLLKRPL